MSKELEADWADEAMYASEPLTADGVRVHLLQGTPDPLGSVVAFSAMYTGKVIRSKSEVTDEDRRYHLAEMQKTKLKAPLEAVNLHFMVEGVTRSFTHQMVRQRTAVYAQESLRFAVVEDEFTDRVALPPSLTARRRRLGIYGSKPEQMLEIWEGALVSVGEAYSALVNMGMPAEDARGLLPHNITTRLNYATNLRNLQDHAGNRLCTQAQFEWREFWAKLLIEMREYCTDPRHQYIQRTNGHSIDHGTGFCDNWQWVAISDLFRPVCYYTGKCQFEAEFDRKCSIRSRVNDNAEIGRTSEKWADEYDDGRVFIGAIHPAEWLMDPGAAR
jgi:flavin-dependent thymidylate synthase